MSFLLGLGLGVALGAVTNFLTMRKQIIRLREDRVTLYDQLLQTQNGFALLQETVTSQERKDSLATRQVQ